MEILNNLGIYIYLLALFRWIGVKEGITFINTIPESREEDNGERYQNLRQTDEDKTQTISPVEDREKERKYQRN